MSNEYQLTDDGYLIQKVVPVSSIQRIIDWTSLNITKEYVKEQTNLKYGKLDKYLKFTDDRPRPDGDNIHEQDRFFITELCMPYNPLPDEKDVFVYYSTLVPLAGAAGYLRIRDGYVYGQRVVIRA